jgi:stress-induced morphogen
MFKGIEILIIISKKVKGYLELNRDRRINQALNKEKVLNQCMRNP